MRGAAMKEPKDKIYDRLTDDLPINSVVAETLVDDPLEPGAKLRVLRQIRNDPLASMYAKGHLAHRDSQGVWHDGTDLLAAGERLQELYEDCQLGTISAIDTTKEKVDGGKFPDMITDRQIKAFREISTARREIKLKFGEYGFGLLEDILINRKSPSVAASHRGLTTAREINFMTRFFKLMLNSLAEFWGYAQSEQNA